MKNFNHLTYTELLNYLDLTATDPATRRLVELLYYDNTTLVQQLIDEGMDPTVFEFEDGYESYSPGEYIRHLRNEVDYYADEINVVKYDLKRAEARNESLEEKIKVWTILESK
jgi:hypothetical protein